MSAFTILGKEKLKEAIKSKKFQSISPFKVGGCFQPPEKSKKKEGLI